MSNFTKKQIADAFQKASQRIGNINIKGRNHPPRVCFPASWISSAAADGTDNWEMITPYYRAGKKRYFPLELVVEAYKLLGYEPNSIKEESPVYSMVEIPKSLAFEPKPGSNGSVKFLRLDVEVKTKDGIKYLIPFQLIGIRKKEFLSLPLFGISTLLQEVIINSEAENKPVSSAYMELTKEDKIPCFKCRYHSMKDGFCSVNPTNLYSESCNFFES